MSLLRSWEDGSTATHCCKGHLRDPSTKRTLSPGPPMPPAPSDLLCLFSKNLCSGPLRDWGFHLEVPLALGIWDLLEIMMTFIYISLIIVSCLVSKFFCLPPTTHVWVSYPPHPPRDICKVRGWAFHIGDSPTVRAWAFEEVGVCPKYFSPQSLLGALHSGCKD